MPDSALPLVYRVHALHRMVERGIREEDVANVVVQGKVIEDYPEDKPYPSRLLLGWVNNRPIHVVSATSEDEIIIISSMSRILRNGPPALRRGSHEMRRLQTR